jgi:hypothetical protein
MYLVLDPAQFDRDHIFFQPPVKNTVMDRSDFVRIIYSDSLIALNGVCVAAFLPTLSRERYFNKVKCGLDRSVTGKVVAELCQLEVAILSRYEPPGKSPVYRIADQLGSGFIKLFTDAPPADLSDMYILKLSGIWETEGQYGLTHKFMASGEDPTIRPS